MGLKIRFSGLPFPGTPWAVAVAVAFVAISLVGMTGFIQPAEDRVADYLRFEQQMVGSQWHGTVRCADVDCDFVLRLEAFSDGRMSGTMEWPRYGILTQIEGTYSGNKPRFVIAPRHHTTLLALHCYCGLKGAM